MEHPIELLTPSGYTVELRPFLTTGGRRAIQKAMARHVPSLGPGMSQEDIKIPLVAQYEAEEEALRQLLLSVTLPDGTQASDPVAAVNEMPEADGDTVYQRINELTNEGQPRTDEEAAEQKNASPASPAS